MLVIFLCLSILCVDIIAQSNVWTKERANEWYAKLDWLAGSNFYPSTAINQLEMWQDETFDPETIDRELGWAADIGFNIMRVYLHYLPWEKDAEGFKERMNKYLEISASHNIKTMFVLFDDCWYGNPQLGKQPDPVPGLHNSGWVQCPRYAEVMDESVHPILEKYTKDIISSFANDERVLVWDLYNEPGNNHYPDQNLPLVKKVFSWAREVNPSQPITTCIWSFKNPAHKETHEFLFANSDIITFHNYGSYETMAKDIANFQSYGRPVICTEYLARTFGSKFETCMPLMKKFKVGAINWGLVFGKSQTVYPWNTPLNSPVPEVWHHDIFYKVGKPFSE
jgi:hypothetical protein